MTDYALGTTIYLAFTTRSFSTGVPTTLGGTPALSVLESNNATPITAGVSVSVDRASVTGLNEATIVATSGNGYEAGKMYSLYISTGTVGGVSVVGEVVGQFTIEAASALRPTTAGRTLDVSAGGEAGLDWANVGSPTTAVDLSGTTIKTTQVVASVTGAVGSVTGAVGSVTGAVGSVTGNVGGDVVGSVGSVTGLTAANLDVAVSTRLATAGYTAPPSANSNADALLDRADAIETGSTPRGAFRLMLAALAGKVSGGGTVTEVFRNAVADSKDRITATVDANGNRTAVTTDQT